MDDATKELVRFQLVFQRLDVGFVTGDTGEDADLSSSTSGVGALRRD